MAKAKKKTAKRKTKLPKKAKMKRIKKQVKMPKKILKKAKAPVKKIKKAKPVPKIRKIPTPAPVLSTPPQPKILLAPQQPPPSLPAPKAPERQTKITAAVALSPLQIPPAKPATEAVPKIPAPPAPPQISQLPVAPMAPPPRPAPQLQSVNPLQPAPGQLNPALELLPEWTDRERMRRVMAEETLSFFSIANGAPEYNEALRLLKKQAKRGSPGYFLVCAKDGSGKVVGALEGHLAESGNMRLLVIEGAAIRHDNAWNLHILMHGAALALNKPTHVLCFTDSGISDQDSAGKLILLGRGLGMWAVPLAQPGLFFMRRVGKDYDPMTTGSELVQVFNAAKVCGLNLDKTIAEFSAKGAVALVMLPNSPDRREHLHELKEMVSALGLPADKLDALLEILRERYVLERMDITPAALL